MWAVDRYTGHVTRAQEHSVRSQAYAKLAAGIMGFLFYTTYAIAFIFGTYQVRATCYHECQLFNRDILFLHFLSCDTPFTDNKIKRRRLRNGQRWRHHSKLRSLVGSGRIVEFMGQKVNHHAVLILHPSHSILFLTDYLSLSCTAVMVCIYGVILTANFVALMSK